MLGSGMKTRLAVRRVAEPPPSGGAPTSESPPPSLARDAPAASPSVALDAPLASYPSVAVVAAVSRAAVLVWAAACAALAPPSDTSNLLLRPDLPTAADAWVERALGHTANWDGAYFAAVAARGYASEKELAFFPGLPACLAALRCVGLSAVCASMLPAS